MDIEMIKRTLKESVMKYHTIIIHTKQANGLFKTYDIEPYEYKTIDGQNFLNGYDITDNKYIDILMSSIIDVYDTGKKFIPRHSSRTILENDAP